jgi:hypothetical protein
MADAMVQEGINLLQRNGARAQTQEQQEERCVQMSKQGRAASQGRKEADEVASDEVASARAALSLFEAAQHLAPERLVEMADKHMKLKDLTQEMRALLPHAQDRRCSEAPCELVRDAQQLAQEVLLQQHAHAPRVTGTHRPPSSAGSSSSRSPPKVPAR